MKRTKKKWPTHRHYRVIKRRNSSQRHLAGGLFDLEKNGRHFDSAAAGWNHRLRDAVSLTTWFVLIWRINRREERKIDEIVTSSRSCKLRSRRIFHAARRLSRCHRLLRIFREDFSCVSKNRRHQSIWLRGGGGGGVCALQTAASIGCSRRTNRMRPFFGGWTPPAHDPSPTHLNISERSNPRPRHRFISIFLPADEPNRKQSPDRRLENSKNFFFFFFNERCCPLFLHPHYADFFVPNNLTIFRDNFTEKFGIFFLILKNWINFILSENWQRRTWICLFYGNFKKWIIFLRVFKCFKISLKFLWKIEFIWFFKKIGNVALIFLNQWINQKLVI